MRILHTADWHLGKRLDSFSRIHEQREVLQEIIEIADREQVDVVIVAGDLFDTFNPPVEAVELLYETLKKLSNNGRRPVIAIAGNHDSPDRIDAPDPLAKACGILFVGYPHAEFRTTTLSPHFQISASDQGFMEITLPQYDYAIRILTTPYANEIRLKQYLGLENKEEQLNEVLKNNWAAIADQYCDNRGVNILTTHLYMLKRGGEILEEPEGEKPLKVGNADVVYSDAIPSQVQYTALGHLHRHHQVGRSDAPAMYSGSPLSYSFSEAGQQKQVIIIEAEPDKPVEYRPYPLHGGRVLVRKKFDNMDECLQWLYDNPNTLVELTIVSDTYMTSAELKSLQEAHDGIIYIIPVVRNRKMQTSSKPMADLEKDVQGLFVDFFQSKHGQAPNAEIMELFKEVIADGTDKR